MDSAAEANARFHPVQISAGIVTRPASSLTVAIHSFLRHLRAKGMMCVPEPLGIANGSETLRYIEGESGGRGWYHQHTEQGVASAARVLRSIHDAGKDWRPPDGAPWVAHAVAGDDLVFCHGDPGPWNFVWRDNEAIALIDWDYLHPAPRLDDVAYAIYWFAPLRSDEHVRDWHHFAGVPDRRQRVKAFIEAYGDLPDFDVAEAVLRRMDATRKLVLELANKGVEPQRSWVADGSDERDAAQIAWIEQHRDELRV